MTNTICLNEHYSTTKLLTKEKPKIIPNSKHAFESVLFLPEVEGRKGEGGLRTKSYYKKSYEDKPLISIITVVYNGEKYLEETIQSVLNQTYDNVEYIIIDGGSTDETVDIIRKYEDKIDYWVSERDKGIYDAMNKGITLCNGEIIGIVNADDFLYGKTLEEINNAFVEKNVMFTFAQIDLAYENGEVFERASSIGINSIKYKLFKHMPFFHPTIFVKKAVYKSIGVFDTRYKLSADYDFVLRLIENNIKFKQLDFSTGIFRMGGQSGGAKSYLENQKLLLEHNVNPIYVYLNTAILFTKLFFRRVFSC